MAKQINFKNYMQCMWPSITPLMLFLNLEEIHNDYKLTQKKTQPGNKRAEELNQWSSPVGSTGSRFGCSEAFPSHILPEGARRRSPSSSSRSGAAPPVDAYPAVKTTSLDGGLARRLCNTPARTVHSPALALWQHRGRWRGRPRSASPPTGRIKPKPVFVLPTNYKWVLYI